MSAPVITIFGATGGQGGGLARALLTAPQRRYRVRAVTRRPGGDAARALDALGAEILLADLDDPAAVQRAMHGAQGAFCVTGYWEHRCPVRELTRVVHLAEAALRERVPHVVWCTQEDTRDFLPADGRRMPVLMGHYNVPQFDAKGAARRAFTERGVPVTLLYPSFLWECLALPGIGPRRGGDGRLVLRLPIADAPLPGIAAPDVGACAAALFLRGGAMAGRAVGVAGEHLTGAQMARALSAALGEPVGYEPVAPAEYARLDLRGADELANMFQFQRDFNAAYRAARPVAVTRALHPGLATFGEWLKRSADRLAGALGAPP